MDSDLGIFLPGSFQRPTVSLALAKGSATVDSKSSKLFLFSHESHQGTCEFRLTSLILTSDT